MVYGWNHFGIRSDHAETYLQVNHPWHYKCGNEQISHSQADYQVVGGGLQGFLPRDGHTHQHIAEDYDENEQREKHGVIIVLVPPPFFRGIEVPGSIFKEALIISILREDFHQMVEAKPRP